MFWGYLLNQRPYRISEHCSTIFITPIIILNTKNRGSLGVLGAKVHAKDRQILCVVWKTCVKSLRKQCLAAIEAISRLPSTVFHESTVKHQFFAVATHSRFKTSRHHDFAILRVREDKVLL